jgi:hypothetical protein
MQLTSLRKPRKAGFSAPNRWVRGLLPVTKVSIGIQLRQLKLQATPTHLLVAQCGAPRYALARGLDHDTAGLRRLADGQQLGLRRTA